MGGIQLELRKFVAPEFVFGKDARLLAASYFKKFRCKKVLLVTDKGLLKTKWIEEIERSLIENDVRYHVFSDITPNPRDSEVMLGAEAYRDEQCDVILAVGGGSVIDCAKGIGIVSTNNRPIEDFEGVDMIEKPMPPLVCIPTTGGTSADVSQFAIINRISHCYKMAIISKATVPDVSLIDPLVLTTMDSFLTACTGMDALSHAFEAYVSNASSNFTDLYALEAIKLIHENLIATVKKPNDIHARANMMLASLYAGLAFSNASLGCVHAMAHSLGGYLDLPHGECNAILLPHVVDFNYNASKEKYRTIFNIFCSSNKTLSDSEIKKKLVESLVAFKEEVGITSSLADKGVSADILETLASKAIKDPCNATNPKPPHKDDLKAIYNQAL